MVIHFLEPPPAQAVGGLDAAVRAIERALTDSGHRVVVNPPGPGGADAAHFHGLWQTSFPGVAAGYRAAGIPCAVSPHGMLSPSALREKRIRKALYLRLREARFLRSASAILTTAEMEAAEARRLVGAVPVDVLPLGLTTDIGPDHAGARRRLDWSHDDVVLLHMARLHPFKGLDVLLRACLDLPAPGRIRLVIVGPDEDPAFAAGCRAFATDHASRLPAVEWPGPMWDDRRFEYLRAADLLCAPSRSENFGLAVLEALQVGTPVLTTTTTPWTHLVPPDGHIAPPTAEGVRRALLGFLDRPHAPADERAARAADVVRRYGWAALRPRYVEFYRRLAAGRDG